MNDIRKPEMMPNDCVNEYFEYSDLYRFYH